MKVNTTNLIFHLRLLGVVCLSWSVNALAMISGITTDQPFSLKSPTPTSIPVSTLGSAEAILAPSSSSLSSSSSSSSPPLADNDDGTLAALFGSHENRDVFFGYYFGTRSPVHIHRSQVELDCSILLQHQSTNLIQHLFESCPYVTLRQNGMPRPVDKTTMTWQFFQEQIFQHGCSAVIPVVQEPSFQTLRASLEACLLKSVVMTIYHSGPNASALLPHTDSYDVLVLQLEGCKDWEIVQGHAETRKETTLTLHPGDVLYIPYNVIHSARTTAGYDSTTHLTIGLLNKWKPDDTLNYSKSINQKNKLNNQ
jgi:Cupin superfamily protein